MRNLLFTCLALLAFQSMTFAQVVITEISYNPPESGQDSLEFIELHNTSNVPYDLTGHSFSSGVTFSFYSGASIPAQGYYVVALDSIAMLNAFGQASDAQWASGGLSNGGETIRLIDGSSATVDEVTYDDNSPWVTSPDGSGPSLVLCDATSDNAMGANWSASTSTVASITGLLASPGAADNACGVIVLPPTPTNYIDSVVITEINYNTPGADNFEFIELHNTASVSYDLTGHEITEGVTYSFPAGASIPANGYYVVTNDSMGMLSALSYNADAEWDAGQSLVNSSETILIVNSTNDTLDIVTYDDGAPWPSDADGRGPSLVLCDPFSDNNDAANWAISASHIATLSTGADIFASPGASDSTCIPPTQPVFSFFTTARTVNENAGVINIDIQVLAPSATQASDIDVAVKSSTADPATDFNFTASTITVAPNATSAQTQLTVLYDPTLEPLETVTLVLRNASSNAAIGADSTFTLTIKDSVVLTQAMELDSIVITEISYNTPSLDAEFVELYNASGMARDLSNATFNDNGATFTFPIGTMIPANDYFVLAMDSTDFVDITGTTADAYVSSSTNITLSNGGDWVVLRDATGDLADSVRYDDVAPWPTDADGRGPSLVLCDPFSDNTDPANWTISTTYQDTTASGDTLFMSPGMRDMACPSITPMPVVSFDSTTLRVAENAGTLAVDLNIDRAPTTANVLVEVNVVSGSTATAGVDYSLSTPVTLTFPVGSTAKQSFNIAILADNIAEGAETIKLEITNITNGVAGNADSTVVTIDNVVSTSSVAQDEAFRFFPNPAHTQLQVESATRIERIEVYNSLGQRVFAQQARTFNTQIDLQNWATGTYMLRVQTENGWTAQRFIKQ